MDPCNPNFFMINPSQRLHVFEIIKTIQFQALAGGDGITLQNVPNYDEFKPLKLVPKSGCSPCDEIKPLFLSLIRNFSKNWMVQCFAPYLCLG